MINEDRMLKTLTFVNIHKHIKALFIMIIKWFGIIDDTLEKKADLIGGKVPAEQLPSYVDDIIDFTCFVTKTELINNIGDRDYNNRTFIVNTPTSDPLYNKIVITNANTSQNDWEIIDPEDGKIYINESNNHSHRWSGRIFVDLDKDFNNRLNAIENKLSIIVKEDNITNAVDDSTANKISISGKIIYEPTDNKIIEFSRGEETKDAIYFISNYSADQYKQLKYNKSTKKFDAVSINNYTGSSSYISNLFVDITGKVANITDELHNQIINTPAIILNNVIYFKTSTVNGNTIYFINYKETGDLSKLIYTIASKSFTANTVSNTVINKEVIISKAMKDIVPTDIFTTSLLRTINIVENANRLNIIVKDNSSIKQALTILNVCKTPQNGDLTTANYYITCTFNGIIYHGNVKNNVYTITERKAFHSLLYSSGGGGAN